MDKITVLYCKFCGWHSDPDVVMKNQCPFCKQCVKDCILPTGKKKRFIPVTLSYVSGTVEEVNEFIQKNLKVEKEDEST
jgi:hypothetical protein